MYRPEDLAIARVLGQVLIRQCTYGHSNTQLFKKHLLQLLGMIRLWLFTDGINLLAQVFKLVLVDIAIDVKEASLNKGRTDVIFDVFAHVTTVAVPNLDVS